MFHESIFPFANSHLASTHQDFFSDCVLPTPILASSDIPAPPTSSSSHLVHVPLPLVPTTGPQQVTKSPSYLSDYHCYLATHSSPIIHINPSFSTSHPISSFLSYHRLSLPFLKFVLAISSHTEPQTFSQAILSPIWCDAMNVKLQASKNNNTWSTMSLP